MTGRALTQTPAEVRALLDGKRTGFTVLTPVHYDPSPDRCSLYTSTWPGDLFWVRESFRLTVYAPGAGLSFARYDVPDTTNPPRYTPRGFERSARHRATPLGHALPRNSCQMPRAASRLTLEVVDVHHFMRLQDMPHDFMAAEGIRRASKDGRRTWKYGMADAIDGQPGNDLGRPGGGMHWRDWSRSLPEAYARWLEQRYGMDAWSANKPALFVEFVVHRENIDHILTRRAHDAAAERAA